MYTILNNNFFFKYLLTYFTFICFKHNYTIEDTIKFFEKMAQTAEKYASMITDYDKVVKWSYSLAKKWASEHLTVLGINTSKKYFKYKQDGGYLPKNFPRIPHEYYKNRGVWVNWKDFLGVTGKTYQSKFLPFEKARDFMNSVEEVQTSKEYLDWKKPDFLPARPNLTYKDKWEGWDDFLGTKPELQGPKNGKLKERDIRIIKHQLKMGVPAVELAKIFNISSMQITRIKRGENWGHITV